MTRPTIKHDGFLIPNATVVGKSILAEPDQIDFNTLAHAQWGVIEGCEVNSQSPKTVAVQGGIAIVNGVLVRVDPDELSLPTPGANAQFVLVVVDTSGTLRLKEGTAAVDPVFPDPELDQTVLASVYCDALSGSFADHIVDKRKMLSKTLLTKIAPTADLLRNVNGTGNHYLVKGDGTTSWANGAMLSSVPLSGDPQVPGEPFLRITQSLIVNQRLQAGEDVSSGGSIFAFGNITGRNFTRGTVLPTVASHSDGDLFVQVSTGNLYILFDGEWSQFASMSATQGVVPFGTVIFSVQHPSVMKPLGWYPMDGVETLSEVDHPEIFQNITVGGFITGQSPTQMMRLPNLNRRTLLVDFTGTGFVGPTQGTNRNGNSVTLTVAQLPAHNHSVGGGTASVLGKTSAHGAHTPIASITAGSGTHGHTVTGGQHGHPVYDSGHRHESMDWYGVAAPCIAYVGFPGTPKDGKNKLDALFNDSSHTYTVEPIRWSMKAVTGISIGQSEYHDHGVTGGGHDHAVTCTEVPNHQHTVTEALVGGNQPIDITPLYYTVYAYLRA